MFFNNRSRAILAAIFVSILPLGFIFGSFYLTKRINRDFKNYRLEMIELLDKTVAKVKSEKNTGLIEKTDRDPSSLTKWSEVEQKCRNSIVQVCSEKREIDWLEPYKTPEVSGSFGSGFILNSDGDVITNYHVVGNTEKVKIQTPYLGKDPIDAKVVGVCPERDIALLSIGQKGIEKIKNKIGSVQFLELGDSDSIYRGQEVITMGFPLGKDHVKATHGIVSGWEKVSMGEQDDLAGQMCLEITAPINPGSSGGPLISLDGRVLGINFAGVANASNVGYVIPISYIKKPIKDLYKKKLLKKPRLGVAPQSTTKAINSYLGAPVEGGIYAVKVITGMLANKAGLKEGDLILQINGKPIDAHGDVNVDWCDEPVHFTNVVNRLEIGDAVELLVWRNGQSKTIKMKIEEAPERKIRWFYPAHNKNDKIDYEIFGGCIFAELNLQNLLPLALKHRPKLMKYLTDVELQDESVLVVVGVVPTSIAAESKGLIIPGFHVKNVNERPVKNLSQLRDEIKNCLSKKFFTVESMDNVFVAFDVTETLDREIEVANAFLIKPQFSISLSEAKARRKSKNSVLN